MTLMGWPMSTMMNRMHMIDRRNGEELAEDHDLAELLVIVQIVRDHQHHGRGGNADQERELADVQAPRYVPVKAGEPQPVVELLEVIVRPPTSDRAPRNMSHAQYFLLPTNAFSSMFAYLLQIVNGRARCPGRVCAGSCNWSRHDLPDLGVLVFQIAEEQAALGRSLDAGRQFPDRKPLGAEGAFFHHALGPRRIFLVLSS